VNPQGPQQTMVNCLPTYILIDTSSSMKPVEAHLNDTLEYLYDELMMAPAIAEFTRLSLISFNTDAYVVLSMTDIQEVVALPQLECWGVTNFSRAYEVVRQRIDADVAELTGANRKVLRPVVFVLTDGQPTDETGRITQGWRPEFERLTDKSWSRHANVVPFGFGNATAEVLKDMSTIDGCAFLAKDSGNSEALRKIFVTLLNTLVASARSNELRLPAEVDGFIRVNQDFIG
jgi:uncharacterized protein YegL